jgi:hypothetical protein
MLQIDHAVKHMSCNVGDLTVVILLLLVHEKARLTGV